MSEMQAGNVISLDKVLGIKRIWICFHWAHSSKCGNLWQVFEKAEFWEGNICCIWQVRVNGSGFFSWFKLFRWINLSWFERQVLNIHIYKNGECSVKELNSTSCLYRTKIQSDCTSIYLKYSIWFLQLCVVVPSNRNSYTNHLVINWLALQL